MDLIYWAWSPIGLGHAHRAAAICRHLDDVLVIRGGTVNGPLDQTGVPYVVIEDRAEAERFAIDQARSGARLVVDDDQSRLDQFATAVIWRLGRQAADRRAPMIRIEGRDAVGPVLILDDDEILSREDARSDLGLPVEGNVRIRIPSATRPEPDGDHGDFVLDRWPALRWMRAADHITGGAGANLYGEVSYLGLDATWTPAPLDAPDQAIRQRLRPVWPMVPDAARLIALSVVGWRS